MISVRSTRNIFYFLGIIIFGCGGIVLLILAATSWLNDRENQAMGIETSMQRLVYQTDHQAVLDACKAVLQNPQSYGFPPADQVGSTSLAGSQNGEAVPA